MPLGLVRDVIRTLGVTPVELVVSRAGRQGVVVIGPPPAQPVPPCPSGANVEERAARACEVERFLLSAIAPPSVVVSVAPPSRTGTADHHVYDGLQIWVSAHGVEVVRDGRVLDGSCTGPASTTETLTVRRGPEELRLLGRCLDVIPPYEDVAVGGDAELPYSRWLPVAAALTARCRTTLVAARVEPLPPEWQLP